jgi:hypothetical protein
MPSYPLLPGVFAESAVLQTTGSTNNTCKPGCVSLDLLAGLAGLQDNCVCLTNTLTDLQQGLGITRQVRGSAALELFEMIQMCMAGMCRECCIYGYPSRKCFGMCKDGVCRECCIYGALLCC